MCLHEEINNEITHMLDLMWPKSSWGMFHEDLFKIVLSNCLLRYGYISYPEVLIEKGRIDLVSINKKEKLIILSEFKHLYVSIKKIEESLKDINRSMDNQIIDQLNAYNHSEYIQDKTYFICAGFTEIVAIFQSYNENGHIENDTRNLLARRGIHNEIIKEFHNTLSKYNAIVSVFRNFTNINNDQLNYWVAVCELRKN